MEVDSSCFGELTFDTIVTSHYPEISIGISGSGESHLGKIIHL